MSSKAYYIFKDRLISDVDELIAIHRSSRQGRRGRHHLGHITRSALIMICTALEHYVELVCKDYVEKICCNEAIDRINKDLETSFAQHIREKPKEYCFNLTGSGWKKCLMNFVDEKTSVFNTPNREKMLKLIKETTGSNLSSLLSSDKSRVLNKIITDRGDVTHKGAKAPYPNISDIVKYRNFICNLVMDVDEFLAMEGKKIYNKQAWCKLPASVRIQPITA